MHRTVVVKSMATDLVHEGHDEPLDIVDITETIKIRDSENEIIDRQRKSYPLFYVDLKLQDNNQEVYGITTIAYIAKLK